MKSLVQILLISIFSIIFSSQTVAKNKQLLDLSGSWKFTIGDEMSWAETGFDDSAWDNIYVPSSWEDEGYPGYNGYAWYRKSFEYNSKFNFEELTLILGFIDDVDEVYLNGKLIGSSGSFPPNYTTSYSSERKYHIPDYLLNKTSKNVIAVRVYDARLQGGILRGNIGIYKDVDEMLPDLNLASNWKFITDDNPIFSKPEYNDSEWSQIRVPLRWDYQGYNDYDGFAWYRNKVIIPKDLYGQKLILLLGKIDDYDQTFFNGVEIGRTGNIEDPPRRLFGSDEWTYNRAYLIPQELLQFDSENTIAVRVYDGYDNGGIYEGPIGIITQERYRELTRNQRRKKSFWELIFGD